MGSPAKSRACPRAVRVTAAGWQPPAVKEKLEACLRGMERLDSPKIKERVPPDKHRPFGSPAPRDDVAGVSTLETAQF